MATKPNWPHLFVNLTPWNKIAGIGSTPFSHATPYTVYGWDTLLVGWLHFFHDLKEGTLSLRCVECLWVAAWAAEKPEQCSLSWFTKCWTALSPEHDVAFIQLIWGQGPLLYITAFRHYFLPPVQLRLKPHTFESPAKFPSSALVSLNDLPPLSCLWFYLFFFLPLIFPFSLSSYNPWLIMIRFAYLHNITLPTALCTSLVFTLSPNQLTELFVWRSYVFYMQFWCSFGSVFHMQFVCQGFGIINTYVEYYAYPMAESQRLQ